MVKAKFGAPDKALRATDPHTGTAYTLETTHLVGFEDVLDLSEQIYEKVIQPWLFRYQLFVNEWIGLGTAPSVCEALRLAPSGENRQRICRALACCATSGISIRTTEPDRSFEECSGYLFELAWEEGKSFVPREPFAIRFHPLCALPVRRLELLCREERAGKRLQ